MNKKTILITGIFTLVTLCSFTTKVQADLQSRPGVASLINQSAEQFFIKARNMEGPNQVMGMDAQIDQANGTKTGGTYNKIDVHMAKNTEWGTVAILSASSYGDCKSGKWGPEDTTTGNKTGVYQMGTGYISNTPGNVGNYEYVATILNGVGGDYKQGNAKLGVAKARYRNNYTSTVTEITGDALWQTQNWKGASHKQGLGKIETQTFSVYIRSAEALFGFHSSWIDPQKGSGLGFYGGGWSWGGTSWNRASSRVVAVCGEF